MKMEWEEIKGETEYWNPITPNEFVQGVVMSMSQGIYGLQTVIQTRDDKNITLPSHKVLQNRLVNVKVGDLIKVEFLGEQPPDMKGRNPTKLYKVLKRVGTKVEDI